MSICSGAWKNASFKKYNFAAAGTPTEGGSLHPLLKVREEFRNIFFEMGYVAFPSDLPCASLRALSSCADAFRFPSLTDSLRCPPTTSSSRPSGTSTLSSFPSNILHERCRTPSTSRVRRLLLVHDPHADADHLLPALASSAEPSTSHAPPEDYYKRVSSVHENGGYGSIGYRAPFSDAESAKLLLRTHTTAVSSAMLYQIANQPGGFKPVKMFSIDRVFRNETTDATHLAEFHQVEGVVADYGITLGDLIGALPVPAHFASFRAL